MTMEGMTDKQLLSHTKLELVSYIRQLEQAMVTNTSYTTEQPTTKPTTKPKVSYDILSTTNNNKDMWGF
ncbi:hypothetical protein phiSHEF5_02 [Enterococcus phage phiSHEF5]|uniref:Uncharacterized protein n=2 Tax=Efquatrovirus TaxID=2560124 RepID=A0A249XUM0_9CAUD|nr:hypothetical protein FDI50_gp02 [Enterococcus phage phiSHEF5]ASZ75658.1 hypothetical protein phiSHEF5_02 [Enterococcus phage phiSHEF5]UGO52558.1 hypothetical protein PAULFLAKE_67 [Enterococcus phage vB_EfaS_Paulomi]UMO76565.1 hypothetical protein [Enterococcus phage phiSHEF11]